MGALVPAQIEVRPLYEPEDLAQARQAGGRYGPGV